MGSLLPFTYVCPAAFSSSKGEDNQKWTQVRLMKELKLKQPVFNAVMKQLDSFFEHHDGPLKHDLLLGEPIPPKTPWITFEGDDDPRAQTCRELGILHFDPVLVEKAFRFTKDSEVQTKGYLFYQVSQASKKRKLARVASKREVEVEAAASDDGTELTLPSEASDVSSASSAHDRKRHSGRLAGWNSERQLEEYREQLIKKRQLQIGREILKRINRNLEILEEDIRAGDNWKPYVRKIV